MTSLENARSDASSDHRNFHNSVLNGTVYHFYFQDVTLFLQLQHLACSLVPATNSIFSQSSSRLLAVPSELVEPPALVTQGSRGEKGD